MAWEWVGPTATAIVGLGGLTATWRVARLGGDQQVSISVRQDRRQAYVELIESLRDVEWSLGPMHREALANPAVDTATLKEANAGRRAQQRLLNAVSMMKLVGPTQVHRHALLAMQDAFNAATTARSGTPDGLRFLDRAVEAKLMAEMKAALGYDTD